MKLIDFDGMFDEKLAKYISENSSKHSESEWEDIIPKLYDRFGDTVVKSIGKTPRAFYAEMSDDDLIKCLKAHLNRGIPVSEFMCGEIETRSLTEKLFPLLDGSAEEREYAMNFIGSDERVIKKYLDMLTRAGDSETKERCLELVREKASLVINEVLLNYKNGVDKEYMLEIMSRSEDKSDEIFGILLNEFRTAPDRVSLNAGYLASYGDERALPYLLDKIDGDVSFLDYRELKFAVEALGGEYKKARDFSSDPYYSAVKDYLPEDGDTSGGEGKNG